ncbi:MAG: hypothetical protein ABIQ09_09975 [Jatrophihabitantaceae bacterium]
MAHWLVESAILPKNVQLPSGSWVSAVIAKIRWVLLVAGSPPLSVAPAK